MVTEPSLASPAELQKLIQRLKDVAMEYDDSHSVKGMASQQEVVARAKAVIAAATDASNMHMTHIGNGMELVAIRTMLHLSVLTNIPEEGSVSLATLAAKTGATKSLLERLLRVAVCAGFIQQLPDGSYEHTKFSYAYSLPVGPGTFFQLVYDESLLMIDDLHLYLQEKGFKEPDDQRYSPYAWKSKQEGTPIWAIMAQHPERFATFQKGMAHVDAMIQVVGSYDFGRLATSADRPVLVDVGGGMGFSITTILRAYPNLKPSQFVLQDLPEPIEQAKTSSLDQRVVRMVHDFFTPQPVKGARAYYLRQVLHDYSDEVCVDILQQLVPAMAVDSVVLIADLIIPERVSIKDVPIVSFDMLIFNMGGKERTASGFRHILEKAGLELAGIYPNKNGFGGIAEARLPAS